MSKYKAAPFLWIRSGPTSPPLPQNVVFGDPLGPVGVVAQTTITNWISVGPVTYVTPAFSIFGTANGLGAFNWIGAKTKTGVEAQTGAKSEVGAQSQIGAESRVGAKADIWGEICCWCHNWSNTNSFGYKRCNTSSN